MTCPKPPKGREVAKRGCTQLPGGSPFHQAEPWHRSSTFELREVRADMRSCLQHGDKSPSLQTDATITYQLQSGRCVGAYGRKSHMGHSGQAMSMSNCGEGSVGPLSQGCLDQRGPPNSPKFKQAAALPFIPLGAASELEATGAPSGISLLRRAGGGGWANIPGNKGRWPLLP